MPTVVLDIGTNSTKCGFSRESGGPAYEIPSVVGLFDGPMPCFPNLEVKGSYVGDDIPPILSGWKYKSVIEGTQIKNWDHYEYLLRNVFDKLKISPEDCNIMLTEPLLNTIQNREKALEILFQSFNVQAVHVCEQPLLSLYASGIFK